MKIPTLTRIVREEDGGAYTLSYVMVIPFIMLFMCLIVESTLMMTAKLGTVYAAYAGARAGSVWSSATTWEQAETQIQRAAVRAFVPFASGAKTGVQASEEADIDSFIRSYEEYVDDPVAAAYVRKKYQNALASLSVSTSGRPTAWNSDIEVTATYNSPFRVPGIGRLLGESDGAGGYFFPVSSVAKLQNEGPQNASQELGIGYGQLD